MFLSWCLIIVIIHQNEVIIVWMDGSRWAFTMSVQKPSLYGHFLRMVQFIACAHFHLLRVTSEFSHLISETPYWSFLPLWTPVVMFHCERTCIVHTPLSNWCKTILETCLTLIWFLVSNREPVGFAMTPEPLKVCEILGMHKKILKEVLCLIMSYRT